MEARESSHSRRSIGQFTSNTSADVIGTTPSVDSLNPSGPPDVKSLVAAPGATDALEGANQDVAGLPQGIPGTDSTDVPSDVKSLIAADSPAAEFTGAIETPTAPATRRRFRPHIRRPHIRPVHMPARVRTFDSFQYPSYLFLWLATVFSSAGFWLQQVVVGWLTYEVTESAFWTSLALGLDALPILLVGPLGGVLVDNFDRKRLLAVIYSYQAVVTSVFAAIVLTGNLEAWHIFVFIFVMGLSWVVSDPARMSLIANIVPRENLVNAFALNSMAFSVTRLAAPAIGGVLIAVVGTGPTLVLEVALQACAVCTALYLQVRKTDRPAMRLPTVFSDLREGVRYVLGEPILIGLFVLTAMPSLLIMPSIQGLLPVYAAEVFHVDSKGLGLLLSAIGAGSTVGTFVLASVGNIKWKTAVLLVSVIVLALATAVFSVNVIFHTAYLNLMIISAAMMTLFSVSSATVQGMVPDRYRGRVSGLYMLTWGMFPLGSVTTGFLADRLGAPHATQIAAGTMLVLFLLAVWRIKSLRQVRPTSL